jgi:hypothetical protein
LSADQTDWMKWVSWHYFSATWPVASAQQNTDMYNKAQEAQSIFNTYHQPYGQAANIWYTDYTRQTIGEYAAIGDSTTFFGYYLGGLCNKYAVTGDSTTLTLINNALDTLDWLTLCTGKNGYIPRFAGLTSDAAYQPYYQAYGNGSTPASPRGRTTWLTSARATPTRARPRFGERGSMCGCQHPRQGSDGHRAYPECLIR